MKIPAGSSSALLQSASTRMEAGKTEKNETSEGKGSYLTVREGDYVYTYVVIGNFQVLLSRVQDKEDEEKDKKESKVEGKDKVEAAAPPKTAGASAATTSPNAAMEAEKDKLKLLERGIAERRILLACQHSVKKACQKSSTEEMLQIIEAAAGIPRYDSAKIDCKG